MNNPLNPPLEVSSVSLLSQLNYFEQIRVITTHPFFTGQCPQCKHKIPLVARTPGQSHCNCCGWSEQPE